jgi:hypothetical protein
MDVLVGLDACGDVKCALAHIYSNGDHCVNRGCGRHGGAPSADKPLKHSESRWGRERGRSIPFSDLNGAELCIALSFWQQGNRRRAKSRHYRNEGPCLLASPNWSSVR